MAVTLQRTDNRPSMCVIRALADATDSDPVAMEPLYHTVDPEALDQLFQGEVHGHVRFDYQDHTVEVHGDGRVSVDGAVYENGGEFA